TDAIATSSLAVADVDGDDRADVIAGNAFQGVGVSGSFTSVDVDNRASAHVDEGAEVRADRSVFVQADGHTTAVTLAGGTSAGTANSYSIGLSLANPNIHHAVRAFVKGGQVSAGLGAALTAPQGVFIEATTKDDVLAHATGEAGANGTAVAASLV